MNILYGLSTHTAMGGEAEGEVKQTEEEASSTYICRVYSFQNLN